MAKVLAKNVLYIGQGVAPGVAPGADTFDIIGNVTAITGPELSKDEVEVTDMDSVNKEFFGDLANPGSINFTCNRNYGNTGQTRARTDAQAQTLRNIRVERLDPSDDSVLETVNFVGEVMEWSEDNTQGAAATVTARCKITQDLTFT